jgi:conjugal transfer pilus assembly protein TraW
MASALNRFNVLTLLLSGISALHADTLLVSDHEKPADITVVDHGVHGELFDIAEEDMIAVLMRRLTQLKESGKLDEFQKEFVEKAKKSVLEPKAIAHITHTTHERVFYVDPTLTIEGDIILPEGMPHAGHVLAKKGGRLNPLHTLKPHKGLLFIDGDDEVQQQFATEHAHQFDIVLVKGKPIELESTLNIPIFFDQGGLITTRYGIKHIPAKMEIDGDRLKFREFKL